MGRSPPQAWRSSTGSSENHQRLGVFFRNLENPRRERSTFFELSASFFDKKPGGASKKPSLFLVGTLSIIVPGPRDNCWRRSTSWPPRQWHHGCEKSPNKIIWNFARETSGNTGILIVNMFPAFLTKITMFP